jgi:transcriptional regulator with XRE-family HTH domain
MLKLNKLKEDLDRNIKIKEQLDKGVTLREIADSFGVSIGLPNYLRNSFDEVQDNLKLKIEYYERVMRLFKEGKTLNQIAEAEGTTKQNISRILKLGNVARNEGGSSKQKKDNIKLIKKLHGEGKTLEEISEITGFEDMKVRQYAYGAELNLTTSTDIRVHDYIENVLKLRDSEKTQKEIAEELGLSQAYVSKILLTEDKRVRLSKEEYLERDINIRDDSKNGLSLKEMMEKHKLSEVNLRRILYKFKDEK